MTKKLYIVTLEPLEQRYTKQWYSFWKKEFSKFFNVIYIDGISKHQDIKTGRFLDVNQTNIWKAQQIMEIAYLFDIQAIKDDDIFLFMDGWNYAITALKYMAQLQNIKIKIYAYFHAGSWDEWDFITQAGFRQWASFDECAWLNAVDGSFVSTRFHKHLITSFFNGFITWKDIHVVGFPMDWKKEIKYVNQNWTKQDMIVFPHRLDKEKQPESLKWLKNHLSKYDYMKTMEYKRTKKEYYEILQQAKISFSASLQETFGIGTVEALMLGAIPVVPYRLSYVELYEKRFLYKDMLEAKSKIAYFIKNYSKKNVQLAIKRNQEKIYRQSLNAIPKMAKIMEAGK